MSKVRAWTTVVLILFVVSLVETLILQAIWAQPTLVLDAPRGPAAQQFRIATGYAHGRKGYVVDHIIPLCAGGRDAVTNLQWQEERESYRKDAFERALCVAMKKQNMQMVQQ